MTESQDECKHGAGTFCDQFGKQRCSICDKLMDGNSDLDDFTGRDL